MVLALVILAVVITVTATTVAGVEIVEVVKSWRRQGDDK